MVDDVVNGLLVMSAFASYSVSVTGTGHWTRKCCSHRGSNSVSSRQSVSVSIMLSNVLPLLVSLPYKLMSTSTTTCDRNNVFIRK